MQAAALLAMRELHKIFNDCTVSAMFRHRRSSWTLWHWCQNVWAPGLSRLAFRTVSALGPNCLGCRSVRKPYAHIYITSTSGYQEWGSFGVCSITQKMAKVGEWHQKMDKRRLCPPKGRQKSVKRKGDKNYEVKGNTSKRQPVHKQNPAKSIHEHES